MAAGALAAWGAGVAGPLVGSSGESLWCGLPLTSRCALPPLLTTAEQCYLSPSTTCWPKSGAAWIFQTLPGSRSRHRASKMCNFYNVKQKTIKLFYCFCNACCSAFLQQPLSVLTHSVWYFFKVCSPCLSSLNQWHILKSALRTCQFSYSLGSLVWERFGLADTAASVRPHSLCVVYFPKSALRASHRISGSVVFFQSLLSVLVLTESVAYF